MTFKHIKFEDSPVMRLLERQASKLGVMPDPIVKEASVEVNLTPSDILIKNIVNLCAGLKAAGFAKHANELENKFFVFKQAQTLYETSKETGEDLVDEAHPKGSAKLDGLDGELAIVETIIDQQLKSIKMTEKSPTGKLASSNDVLKAVKFALAQESVEDKLSKLTKEQLIENMKSHILNAYSEYAKVKAIIDEDLIVPVSLGWAITFNKARENPSVSTIKDVIKLVSGINTSIRVRLDSTIYSAIQPGTAKTLKYLNNALTYATYYLTAKSNAEVAAENPVAKTQPAVKEAPAINTDPRVVQLTNVMHENLNKLNLWYGLIVRNPEYTQDDKNAAANFLIPKINQLNVMIAQFANYSQDEKVEILNSFVNKLQPIEEEMPSFKELWIN